MKAAITLALEVAGMLPSLISAGQDVWSLFLKVKAVRDENRAPDDAEWQQLHALCNDLDAQFDAAAKPRPAGT